MCYNGLHNRFKNNHFGKDVLFNMLKRAINSLLAFTLLSLVVLAAGCGDSSNLQRITGLGPDAVVRTFFNAAKTDKMNEAGLYVSPTSKGDTQTVLKFMTGQSGLDQIKNSNLISVQQVASKGDFAVVLATLQMQNTLNLSVKPVGLEKVNGEWYIIDTNQALTDAKYQILQQLLSSI